LFSPRVEVAWFCPSVPSAPPRRFFVSPFGAILPLPPPLLPLPLYVLDISCCYIFVRSTHPPPPPPLLSCFQALGSFPRGHSSALNSSFPRLPPQQDLGVFEDEFFRDGRRPFRDPCIFFVANTPLSSLLGPFSPSSLPPN